MMTEGKIIIRINFIEEVRSQRLLYVLDFIEHHPLCNDRLTFVTGHAEKYDFELNYGCLEHHSMFIPSNLYLFTDKVKKPVKFFANKYLWDDTVLYDIAENLEDSTKLFFENNCFGFDIFETIFFHLSRIEEIWMENSNKGSGDWMKEDELLLIREKIQDIPVVDNLVWSFIQVLGLDSEKKLTEYILTHDIDKIFKYNQLFDGVKAVIWPVIFRRSLFDGLKNLYYFIKVWMGILRDPYDSFQFLLSKDTFWKEKIIFFMAGGKSNYDLFDKFYKRDFPDVFKESTHRGYICGIHPSYHSGSDDTLFLNELKFLKALTGQEVVQSRQHWLRFFHNYTPALLEKYGIKTDHTMGYTRYIGFRCGTGFKFNLYNFGEERAYLFRSMPLVLMDSSLIHYCNEDLNEFSRILKTFLNKNKFNTCITFNFHNSTFDYTLGNRNEIVRIYLDMITEIKDMLLTG